MAKRTIEEAIAFIEENDVKFIRLAFCDIMGRHRNVAIMPQELGNAFAIGIGFDYKKIAGETGEEDVRADIQNDTLFLRPDPATLTILPWRPQTGRVARFYCDICHADGTPFLYDSRNTLKQTLLRCKENGFSCRMGLRSEFYLFKTDEDGEPTDIPWDNGGYLDVSPLDKGENIRREICLTLEEMGVVPASSHHEAGPGQNEIDFMAADALRSADNFMTYRNVVTSIAAKNGGYASFDPFPVKNRSGNGLHLEILLHKGGENICESEPELFLKFMGGVYANIRAITPFLNPMESSYARFGQDEAPKAISWSHRNSSRLLRLSKNADGQPNGFILRSPDPSVNPYLAFAMLLEAGLYGIANDLTLPDGDEKSSPVSKGGINKFQFLPLTLEEAIAAAKDSTLVDTCDCKEIADYYLAVIRNA